MEAKSTGDSVAQLAKYLCTDCDVYDPLQAILDNLDASLIPLVPVVMLNDTLRLSRVSDAVGGLMRMATIFLSVNFGPQTQESELYRDRAYTMVIPKWQEIARWMLYLLSSGHGLDPRRMEAATDSVQTALRMLCHSRLTGNVYQDELLSQSVTASILFLLLGQKDRQTGRFWDTMSSNGFVICNLLHQYCHSELGRCTVVGRLAVASKKVKRTIVAAILARARETVLHIETTNLHGVATSLIGIVDAVAQLANDEAVYRAFEAQNFLVEFIQDLCLLSSAAQGVRSFDGDNWFKVSYAVAKVVLMAFMHASHPARRIAALIDAGILECASRCLQFTTVSEKQIVGVLRGLLPYLHPSKPFLVGTSDPRQTCFWNDTAPSSLPDSVQIWSAWKMGLEDSAIAFDDWKDAHIGICSNITVRDPYSVSHD